ncbi:MAG: M15 family metallopeptidase [Actinomycetota bacterium]|nr:M15 family metallopeptidase [Actinomycetota bacterium]
MTSAAFALVLVPATTPARATTPGANGKFALETCGPEACRQRGIWLTNADGTGLERLVARGGSPAWAPGGRRIAFDDDRFGTSDIFVTGLASDSPTRLTQTEADDEDPTWSFDGWSIAFTRRGAGSSHLYVMKSDGTVVDRVEGTEGAQDPAWSPNDDRIAFADEGVASRDIKVVDLSEGTISNVTTDDAHEAEPTWSPDGTQIAFERRVSETNVEIFKVPAVGGAAERVTTAEGNDGSPVWSPDGEYIAFLASRNPPGLFRTAVIGGTTERIKQVAARSVDWQACAKGSECPGGRAERLETRIRSDFEKTQRKIHTWGRVRPPVPGAEVEVTLSRRNDGEFRQVATKRDQLNDEGRYRVSFRRPRRGTCRLVARFGGNDDYAVSEDAETFKCAIPLHLVAYSPEQLPSRTERALEKINGVKASTMWSGSKFMKSSRTYGGRVVDRPPGSYKIPLDVAFVEPNEFARFAQNRDRDAIRSLGGNKALMAAGEVRLRKGHDRLKMRFSVGRARSIGAISNKSAQGYELILPMPAPRASVAFRTILIEKPPGVTRKRIARKLRNIAGSKPLELRSEKQVPYLRHGMLVQPQLKVKRAFGEFSIRPTSGRSLSIGGRWVSNNIKTDGVPVLGRVTCHRKIFRQLRGAMSELRRRGLAHTARRSNYAGCFNPRFISSYTGSDVGPVKRLSRHAYGIALDINAGTNPFGRRPRQDGRLVRIMKKWGFTWGGRWAIPDGMHFEWERFRR